MIPWHYMTVIQIQPQWLVDIVAIPSQTTKYLQQTVSWYILSQMEVLLNLVFNLNIINILLNQILNKKVCLKVFFSFFFERWLFFKTSIAWILPVFSYKYFKNYKSARGLLIVIANQLWTSFCKPQRAESNLNQRWNIRATIATV